MDKKQFDTLKRIVDAVDSEKLPDNVGVDLNEYNGKIKLTFEVKEEIKEE
jgi:hypothetical protein